mmetsp:Transcript_80060/g.253032  ORF Transcript_80060/g.253032 Transcript_80060/m.253032 type:complete len:141 (+) Transcript_80060:27-449(+)
MRAMHKVACSALSLGFAAFWQVRATFSGDEAASRGTALPNPRLDVAFMPDPRAGSKIWSNVSVVGFYFPSHNIKVDDACQAPFLGNFWTPAVIRDFAPPSHPSDPHTFSCSEAAYWASQWWSYAAEFEGKNGQRWNSGIP